jgi:hypothetical protein
VFNKNELFLVKSLKRSAIWTKQECLSIFELLQKLAISWKQQFVCKFFSYSTILAAFFTASIHKLINKSIPYPHFLLLFWVNVLEIFRYKQRGKPPTFSGFIVISNFMVGFYLYHFQGFFYSVCVTFEKWYNTSIK